MAMSKLTKANRASRELVTEILDRVLWWDTLKVIVQFLDAKNVQQVRVEYGFVLDRDLKKQSQGQDQIIQLVDLESFIQRGLDEGTIEWGGGSDFLFHALGVELGFMLCNDADLHFASADSSLLLELGHRITSGGIKVYDSGRLI
jgi:hypothetical protein